MLAKRYFESGLELLNRLYTEQLENIEQAAELIAQAVADGFTFYAWGGPHSSLPVQDIFWRAGGLAIVNPLFTPGFKSSEARGVSFSLFRWAPRPFSFVSP